MTISFPKIISIGRYHKLNAILMYTESKAFSCFFFFAKTPLRLVNSHGMYFFTSLMMAPQEKSFTDDWFTFFDNSFLQDHTF